MFFLLKMVIFQQSLCDRLPDGISHGKSLILIHMGVSKNRGVSPQIIHLFIGFSIIFTIHFGEGNTYERTPMNL